MLLAYPVALGDEHTVDSAARNSPPANTTGQSTGDLPRPCFNKPLAQRIQNCADLGRLTLRGSMNWFNNARGYGFLGCEDGAQMYSSTTVPGECLRSLHEE